MAGADTPKVPRPGTPGAPRDGAVPGAARPTEAPNGVSTRRRIPREGVPYRRQPAVRPITGVAPVLAVTTIMAVQVAETAVRSPLAMGVIGAPPASLARGLRGRARAAVLAAPEIAIPGRSFGPKPRRGGLPSEPGASVGGGPEAPVERAKPCLLGVREPVAGPPLEEVAHAYDVASAVIVSGHRPPAPAPASREVRKTGVQVPCVLRRGARRRRGLTPPLRIRARTAAGALEEVWIREILLGPRPDAMALASPARS